MALSITATSVVKGASAQVLRGVAGETITAGQPIYKSSSDSLLYLADADDTSKLDVAGIALNGGAINQPIEYDVADDALVIGGTLAIGDILLLGPTAGSIEVINADTATAGVIEIGDYVVVLGVARSTTTCHINFQSPMPLRSAAAIV